MKIDENIAKDKGNLETTSPYYPFHKALLAVLSKEKEFFEILSKFVINTEEHSSKTTLYHWITILNNIDEILGARIKEYKAFHSENLSEIQTLTKQQIHQDIAVILDFMHSLLRKARNKSVFNSVEHLIQILKLDSWELVNKSLKVVVSLVDKAYTYREETKAQQSKELAEWLLIIAFGYNLKNSQKLSFIDILRDKALIFADLHFQYYSKDHQAGKEVPTITTIRLKELFKDARSSEEIAKEIAQKRAVPEDLQSSLWCKVRLAKTVTSQEIKEQVVIASLYAYIAFIFANTDSQLANQFLETEPKVRLIPSIIQLLKQDVPSQFHCMGMQLLTALLFSEANSSIGIDLFPTVINQIGILSPNGLLQEILRDLTTLQLTKGENGLYNATALPELLPKATAENSDFATKVLNFLCCFERSIVRGQSAFMNGLTSSLFNFLLLPVEQNYPHSLPVLTKAMQLLNIFMRHSLQDYSDTDSIIKRLCIELQYLQIPEKDLHYVKREFDPLELHKQSPKLEHRQELCKILFKLLSSSINFSIQRNPALQNALNGNARMAEMQQRLDQQMRVARRRGQRPPPGQGQNQVERELNEREEESQREEEKKDESIVVSRRVLESNLIDLCTEVFAITGRGISKSHDSISYSALTLIASVIKDIPTSVPDLIARGLIPSIINCYCTRIPIEDCYLRDILRGLNAIVLHNEGSKIVADKMIVYQVLSSLLKEEYAAIASTTHHDFYDESAKQLLNLYAQSEALRVGIVGGIKTLFLGLYQRSNSVIRELAAAIQEGHEKDKLIEKCCQCAQALKGVLYFMVSLIQNVESSDHAKMLESINADCQLVRNILLLCNIIPAYNVYTKIIKKAQGHIALIIRQYTKDIFENKENTEVVMGIVKDFFIEIGNKLGNIDELAYFSGFLNGKNKLHTKPDDYILLFPPQDQAFIMLNIIENQCEIIKHLGISSTANEDIIKILSSVHKLLIREILNISEENKCENIITINEPPQRNEDSTHFEQYCHFIIPFKTEYEILLEQTYQQVRKSYLSIMKSAITKRKYEKDSPNQYLLIFKSFGKLVSDYFLDILNKTRTFSKIADKKEQLHKLWYLIIAIDDAKLILFYEIAVGHLVQEFYMNGGLETLLELYQWVVTETILARKENEQTTPIVQALTTLTNILLGTFEKLLDPNNIKKQLTIAQNNYSELGFKTAEDFIVSLIIYIWEGILIKTNYGEFNNCIKFLGQCNIAAFEVFLNIIKKYSDRKHISALLHFDMAKNRRDLPFFAEMFPQQQHSESAQSQTEEPRPAISGAQQPPHHENTQKVIGLGNMRRIEAKEIQKEFEQSFNYLMAILYESLYSISSSKSQHLLFSLVDSQEGIGMYKTEKFFSQLLNEIQMLICSIEFSFDANLIPNTEYSYPDFADLPLTPALKEKIQKEESADYPKEEIMVFYKIGILVELILTFIRQSKIQTLTLMCSMNQLSRCLIAILGVISSKNKILFNKDLIPKILVLLSLIYKETFFTIQCDELEKQLQELNGQKHEEQGNKMCLPSTSEVKLLIASFAKILEQSANQHIEESPDKKPISLFNTEIITLILLILHYLSTDYNNINEILGSGIMASIFSLKSLPEKEKIPIPLFIQVIVNLMESPEQLGIYMKRIIINSMFAKTGWAPSKGKHEKINYQDLQEKTGISVEDFIGNMRFLLNRNPKIFMDSCRAIVELRKETKKSEENKENPLTNNIIVLSLECIEKTVQDKKRRVPEVPLSCMQLHLSAKDTHKSSQELTAEEKTMKNYKQLLQNSIKESTGTLGKTTGSLMCFMLERLIEINSSLHNLAESKGDQHANQESPDNLLIGEETIIEAMSEFIRIYPETISLLLSFKSAKYPKICGATLVSFLLRSVFPQRYLQDKKGKFEVVENEKWKEKTLKFVKHLMYENKNLMTIKHRVLLSEMKRRVVYELLTILSSLIAEKRQGEFPQKSLSLLNSCLSIFEGLLTAVENSISFPISNVYQIIKLSLSTPSLSLIHLCMELLKGLNMHSGQAEILTTKLVKILERLTRFNAQKRKSSDKKTDEDVLLQREDSEDLQNLHINPVVREIAQREEQLEGGESFSVYSDEYIESSQSNNNPEGEFSEEDMEEQSYGMGSEEGYSESIEQEEGAEEMEENRPMDVEDVEGEDNIEEEGEDNEEQQDSGSEEDEDESEENEGNAEGVFVDEGEEDSDNHSEDSEAEEMEGSNELFQYVQQEDWNMEDESEDNNFIQVMAPMSNDWQRMEGNEQMHINDRADSWANNVSNVNIDAPPSQRRQFTTSGMAELYERAPEDAVNSQILQSIRPENLGEEVNQDGTGYRVLVRMRVFPGNEAPVFVSREEEKKKRKENTQMDLFGHGRKQEAAIDIIRKQLIGGALKTSVVIKEEEKESKEEVKEIAKEEKKIELPVKMEEEAKQTITIPHPEERKAEQKKENNEQNRALIEQRRAELALIMPGVQVEDSLLLQIDLDFLRALPNDMRLQAVEPFLAQARNPARQQIEIDPGTFLASIHDTNVRNEIILGAGDQFIAALPPDLAIQAEELRQRFNLGNRRRPRMAEMGRRLEMEHKQPKKKISLEKFLIEEERGEDYEKEISEKIATTIKVYDEKEIEGVLRLLYLNIKTKIPINALIGNMCYSRKSYKKILDALMFILVNGSNSDVHGNQGKMSEGVCNLTLSDSTFPPQQLYNSLESSHLTYYIVSLRIFGLLSHLLRNPNVIHYIFPKKPIKSGRLPSLSSIKKLRKRIGNLHKENYSPLTEILCLVDNVTFRTSVIHLETLIQFIIGLFGQYEEITKREGKISIYQPTISDVNVKQLSKFYFLDVQTDKSCGKLNELLTKLTSNEKNSIVIIEELGKIIEGISQFLNGEWLSQIKKLEDNKVPKASSEQVKEEVAAELKLGRMIRLLKEIYKGQGKEEEETEQKAFKFAFNEEDSEEEILPTPKKVASPHHTKSPKKESVDIDENEKKRMEIMVKILDLYEKPYLNSAFDNLTDFVTCITKCGAKISPAVKNQILFKLVPAIEGLVITYNHIFDDPKHSKKLMKEIKDATCKKQGFTFESQLAHTLYKFLEYNNKTVNNLIRQLAVTAFLNIIKPFILRFPNFLDFDNKRSYFRGEIRKMGSHNSLRLTVSRSNIFLDSYNQLGSKSPEEMRGKLRVTLRGEAAVDAGGVTREWYTALSKAMFNPDICLFKRSAHGSTYQPDPKSVVVENYLKYFEFIGRIIGKALLDGQNLECFFTRGLYKIIVGQTLTIHDLEDYDVELYKGLEWVRDNDPACLDTAFSYTMDHFGELKTVELIENGKNIRVVNENKHDFIVRMCKAKLYDEIKPQMEAILKGLYELIPRQLISVFDAREIELLISGLPDIDIFDLKKNTEYNGYTEQSSIIKWFWEVLESFSSKERAEFLQFVTGTSRVPLDGFKSLPGAMGIQKFQIHKIDGGADRLPSAHTCFNQLDLPEYQTKEILQERLLKSIKEGAEFMGIL